MGDRVLVYFGYPQAHEDDAERAVCAGLTLLETVRSLTAPEPLQVRIGIGTGLVVVGDLVGSGEAQERGVVGETPNLAARLQAAAAPDTVVIDPTTQRLLAGLFEYRDLGRIEVKGFATAVQAYEVVRPSTVESRFEALHTTGLTALVGREEESELLLRRWSRSKTGEGQVVLIRRGRHWEITADRNPSGPRCRRNPLAPALLLFAAAHGQRALSDHRPDGAYRWTDAR
jgi:Adenylate and Guanylate cyclase catalytic domain